MEDSKTALRTVLACMLCILICIWLPFVVVDLVYAAQDTTCVNQSVDNMSITLKTWLQIDAYTRIAILSYVILAVIYSCVSECSIKGFVCFQLTLMPFGLFSFAWLCVGAALFWGELDSKGICSESVKAYMYAVLILGFLGVCGQCSSALCQNKNSGD